MAWWTNLHAIFVKMNIQGHIDKFSILSGRTSSFYTVIDKTVEKEQDVLLSLNRDQMLLGRNTDGDPFTPSYLDDPYFKTSEQAQAYANMKKALESIHRSRIENPINYPDKDSNTPNLIVTGPFQDSMFIQSESDSFFIDSRYEDSGDIENKYNGKVFGLAPLSMEFFYTYYLLEQLKIHLYEL